jgi:mannobiose 2-epimerase
VVSYGHDLETAWLLYDAARVLGRTEDEKPRAQIIKIASLSGREGFDSTHGGYFQYGIPGGAVTDRTKIWWIQAEAVLGLLRLYLQSGETVWL